MMQCSDEKNVPKESTYFVQPPRIVLFCRVRPSSSISFQERGIAGTRQADQTKHVRRSLK